VAENYRTEGEITRAIRAMLKRLGIFHFKYWGGPMSAPGIADILGCHKGRFFAIEVKANNRKPTDSQSKFLRNIREAGGIAFVARSVEDVVKGLRLQDQFLPGIYSTQPPSEMTTNAVKT